MRRLQDGPRPHISAVRRLRRDTQLAIRGCDLREDKRRALDNCAEAGLTVTLLAAIEPGVNEHEIGAIVCHGVRHPAVDSVFFQPVTHAGRHRQFDPTSRLTNPEVIRGSARSRGAPSTSSIRVNGTTPSSSTSAYVMLRQVRKQHGTGTKSDIVNHSGTCSAM